MYQHSYRQIILYNLCYYVSDPALQETATLLVGSGLRGNTHRTYNSAQRKYLKFCAEFNHIALPTNNELLLKYVAFLYQEGLKGTSIKVYLSAVRSLHVFSNLAPPVYNEKLLLALKGAVRLSRPPDRKLPITYQILKEIFPFLEFRHNALLLKAVMSMSFFGCFRSGELCLPDGICFNPMIHLTYDCITLDPVTRTVNVLLRSSKTDVLDQGVNIKVGCAKTRLSAYTLMSAFLEAHPCPYADSLLFVDANQIILRKSHF